MTPNSCGKQQGLRTIKSGHLDTMDLSISFTAEEGPLSPLGEGNSPSTLALQLSYEAFGEASPLEVSVFMFYNVHCVAVFNVHVCAIVRYGTRGVKCLLFLGVKGLKCTQLTYNARIQVN